MASVPARRLEAPDYASGLRQRLAQARAALRSEYESDADAARFLRRHRQLVDASLRELWRDVRPAAPARARRGGRLRPRRALSALGRRRPVPAAARPRSGRRRTGRAVRRPALGRRARARPQRAHGRGVPRRGRKGRHRPDLASRGAADRGEPHALRAALRPPPRRLRPAGVLQGEAARAGAAARASSRTARTAWSRTSRKPRAACATCR